MKASSAVIWTLCCVAVIVVAVYAIGHDRHYQGTDFNVVVGSLDRVALIAREPVSLEATSSGLFMLVDSDGEFLAGHPEKKPLGWSHANYVVLEAVPIQEGIQDWNVEEGESITLHFTSTETFKVVRSLKSYVLWVFGLSIWAVVALVWGMVLAFSND